jgi:hypothetical protein
MLRSLHCRYAQGFLIARPMPSDRLDEVYAIGEGPEMTGDRDAERTVLVAAEPSRLAFAPSSIDA